MKNATHGGWWCAIGVVALAATIANAQTVGPTYNPSAPQRRGQSGMTFLQMGGSARIEAMGGAYTSNTGDIGAVFYNVAGAAHLHPGPILYFTHTNWISDMTVSHFAAAYALPGATFGITFESMNYGSIIGTIADPGDPNNLQGYYTIGNLQPSAWAFGLFTSIPLTDRFSFGVRANYAVQDFGSGPYWIFSGSSGTSGYYTYLSAQYRASAFAFDIASQYNTGYRGVLITMALRNYGHPFTFVTSSNDLPLTYEFGISDDILNFLPGGSLSTQHLNVAVDAVDAQNALLDAAVGIEYTKDLSMLRKGLAVALRAGRRAGNFQGKYSFGGGLTIPAVGTLLTLDYAYDAYGPDFNAQQWSLTFQLQ